jgi:hypothetical protein
MNLPALPSKIVSTTIGIVLLVGLAFWGKSCYDSSVVSKAALAASQKHLLEQADSLRGALKVSNEQVAHDTVVRNQAVVSYRTLRDTLRLTDTVQVKVVLARADTVIQKDSAAIRSLVLGIHVRDATIFNRDSTIKVLNARFPTARSRLVTDVKWILIGAAADELYHAVRSKRP